MSDENDVYLPPDADEDKRKYFEERFETALKQINYKKFAVMDEEFSSVPVEPPFDAEPIFFSYISPLLKKCESRTGKYVPLESALEVLSIIAMFLDNDEWELNKDMKKYLSSRLKETVNKKGSNIQKAFHLRKSDGDEIKHKKDAEIGRYILFRMRFSERMYSSLQITHPDKVFNGMLSDELENIFEFKNADKKKIDRYIEVALMEGGLFGYERHCDFLSHNNELLKKYWKYSQWELKETTNKNKSGRDLRIQSIQWIKDVLKHSK